MECRPAAHASCHHGLQDHGGLCSLLGPGGQRVLAAQLLDVCLAALANDVAHHTTCRGLVDGRRHTDPAGRDPHDAVVCDGRVAELVALGLELCHRLRGRVVDPEERFLKRSQCDRYN